MNEQHSCNFCLFALATRLATRINDDKVDAVEAGVFPGILMFEHLTNADLELGFACENHKLQFNLSFWIIPISWEFHILSPTKNAAGVNTFDFNYHNRIPPKEVQHFPKINIVTLCCNLAIPPSPGVPNIVRWHPWTAKMLMLPRLHGLQITVSGNNHKRNTISCCFISPIIRKVIFTPRVPLGFAKLSVRLWSLVGPRGPPLGGGSRGVRRSQ